MGAFMQSEMTILFTIAGMALVTVLPRILPLLLLSAANLPGWLRIWLEYIPVAVLAAMLVPSLLIADGHLDFSQENVYLWAALPCLWVTWHTRSLLGTVGTGLVIVIAARLLGM